MPLEWRKRFQAKHVFTHIVWEMTVYRLAVSGDGPAGWAWCDPAERGSILCPRRLGSCDFIFLPARDFPFFCASARYFLSRKERGCSAPRRGCLRRVTFFPWRKKVTKERHLRKGGISISPFLKDPSLETTKGRGRDPSPLETSPRGFGDYQIAPLLLCGKGRRKGRHLKDNLAMKQRTTRPCISERKRQRKEKQRQCNI